MYGYVQLLRDNPNYARLWIAQAVSLLGDWFNTIALSTLVARFSNQSGLAIALLLLARFLPPLLVGPFAGVLVDRLNRKRLLILSDSLRVVVVLLFLLATGPQWLWLIYLLTVIQFSLSALFEPARSAIIPALVKPDDLVRANLLGSATWSVMLAAGAALGGLVAALFGTAIALCIDSASFAISAWLIASIEWKPASGAAAHPSPASRESSQLGFRDGLRYIARHPATGAVLLVKLGGSVGSVDALMVIYATQLFVLGENGTGSLGVLYAAFGIGAVIGPLLLDRFNNGTVQTMRRLIVVGYACLTFGWFLFSGAPTLFLVALAIVVKAIGSSIYWTYSSVIIQKVTPDHFLGRLFSLDLAGFQLATVISVLITGWVIDLVGPPGVRRVVFGTGIVSLLPLLLWVLALPWIERQEVAIPAPQSASDVS
jgi:MFS family permease